MTLKRPPADLPGVLSKPMIRLRRDRGLPLVARLWREASPNLRGITMMILSTFLFAGMHVMIRYISSEIHPIQTAFFRNFFGLLVFLPLIMRQGLGFMRTDRIAMHGLRAGLNVVAMFAYFTALSIAPIARVTALAFSAPIFTAVLSVLILGERFRLRRWSAIILGFAGTLVILRPGVVPLDLGSMLVLFSAALWGITMIVIKVLSRTESSMTITGYMNLLLSVLSFLPALYVWTTPSLEAWGWLVLIAIFGTIAQIALAQALKEADTTAVLPFDFLKLVWVSILGAWLFSETSDLYTWIGAFIVFGSGFYIAYRERTRTRK
jgi:drug/metabolite transporter (DMT)-like permease